MQSKKYWRDKCKKVRSEMYLEGILEISSKNILKALLNFKPYKNAKNILLYHPKNTELDFLGLVSNDKNFYLPRCEAGEIVVCNFKSGDKLFKSTYGILEPTGKSVDISILDMIITPCLCADRKCNRLGWGAGYYDRFFKKTNAIKVVAVPKELLFDEIPTDENDIKCDFVITEDEIINL